MTEDPDPRPALRDPDRLAALRRTALLDTPAEAAFDRLTRLAARMLDAPIALVTLVDADRQFFKSSVGLPEPWASRRETPLPYSFCQYVVASAAPVVIPDARLDARVQGDPAVTELGMIAYAGIPLVTADGYTLGSFCVIDTRPRTWTPEQIGALTDLAASVMTEIDLDMALREARTAWERQRAFMDTAPVGVLTFSPEGVLSYENRESQRIFTTPGTESRQDFRLLDEAGNALPTERIGLMRALCGEDFGETGVLREDLIVERGDGSRVWIQAHVSRVSEADGALLGVLIVCTDITERVRVAAEREAALEALELRHRAIEEDPNGVVIADARQPDCPVTYVNAAFQRITGYSAAEAIGRNCRFLQGDEREQPGRETLRAAIAAGRDCRVLLRNFRKDGTPFWNELSLAPIHDARGDVTHFIGILVDVTAQKQAEEALRRSEERFRSLVIAFSQIVWTADAEGRVEDIPEWRAYTGQSREEVRGWGWLDALHPDDRERAARAWREAVANRSVYEVEFRVRGADGAYYHFISRGVPLRDAAGGVREWVGICYDITQRRQAQEALRASEERFRLLVEGARDYALLMLDTNGRVVSWSAGAERILGWTEAEALGQPGAFLFTPEDRAAGIPEQEMRTALAAGRAEDKRWHLRKDGTRFFADGVMTSLRDRNGALRGFAKVMRDATERQRAEEERAHLLHNLQVFARREALANRIGQALRTAADPAFVQHVAVEELGRALEADRCYFISYVRGRAVSRIEHEWRRGPDVPALAGQYRFSEASQDVEALLRGGRTLVAEDVEHHPVFAPGAAMLAQRRVRSCVLVPFAEGENVAALGVAMADAPRAWTPDEVALVEMVAAQTRSTMEAARSLHRKITIAEQLQAALTPALPGRVPGLDLASFYRPALSEANVGGDFFDVFPLEKGCIALVIGDLSGKGLQAAAQVATVRNMLRFALYRSGTLAESIQGLNDAITEHDLLTGFVTLFAGIYDSGKGTFTYVSCGHEPGLLYRAGTGTVEEMAPTGPVIGALTGSRYAAPCLPVASGDVFLLYTDGLSEAGRNRYDFLETEGLARLLAESVRGSDAQAVRERLMAAVEAHTAGTPHDDMCALIARVEGKT